MNDIDIESVPLAGNYYSATVDEYGIRYVFGVDPSWNGKTWSVDKIRLIEVERNVNFGSSQSPKWESFTPSQFPLKMKGLKSAQKAVKEHALNKLNSMR